MNYGGNGIRRKKKLLNSSATKFRTKFNIFFIKLLLVGAIAVVISGSCLIFGAAQGIIESAPDISSINVSPEGYATKIYWNLVKGSVYSVSSGCCKRLYFFTIVIVYLSCVTFG